MAEILRRFGDGFGEILALPAIQLAILGLLAYAAVLWVAAAWWAYRDASRRIEHPLPSYMAAALVLSFTPLFFPFALVLYRLVRPQEDLDEQASRLLARRAARASRPFVCPRCGSPADARWVRCPACTSWLATSCPSCGGNVADDWVVCAWCTRELADDREMRAVDASIPVSVPVPLRPFRLATAPPSPAAAAPVRALTAVEVPAPSALPDAHASATDGTSTAADEGPSTAADEGPSTAADATSSAADTPAVPTARSRAGEIVPLGPGRPWLDAARPSPERTGPGLLDLAIAVAAALLGEGAPAPREVRDAALETDDPEATFDVADGALASREPIEQAADSAMGDPDEPDDARLHALREGVRSARSRCLERPVTGVRDGDSLFGAAAASIENGHTPRHARGAARARRT